MIELPLYTRSTEVKEILGACSLRWILDHAQPTEDTFFTWFSLGTRVHEAIEHMTLEKDYDLHAAIQSAQAEFTMDVMEAEEAGKNVVWSKARPTTAEVWGAIQDCLTWWDEMREDEGLVPEHIEVSLMLLDEGLEAVSTPDVITKDHRIVDYKTGVGANNDPVQLWFYHWLARKNKVYDLDVPFRGEFWHLTHGKIQVADPYPGDRAIEHMVRQTQHTKLNHLFYPRPGWYCVTCPHAGVCPAKSDNDLDSVLPTGVKWVPLIIAGKEADEQG